MHPGITVAASLYRVRHQPRVSPGTRPIPLGTGHARTWSGLRRLRRRWRRGRSRSCCRGRCRRRRRCCRHSGGRRRFRRWRWRRWCGRRGRRWVRVVISLSAYGCSERRTSESSSDNGAPNDGGRCWSRSTASCEACRPRSRNAGRGPGNTSADKACHGSDGLIPGLPKGNCVIAMSKTTGTSLSRGAPYNSQPRSCRSNHLSDARAESPAR